MGALISADYLEQQKALHATKNYGNSSWQWEAPILRSYHAYKCQDILDYGCGMGMVKDRLGDIVREYDPCIEGKDTDPEPADMVVCTDVLEHIEPDYLDDVLAHLASKVRTTLFVVIALRPALKSLPDGRNAHLIVKPADWWREKLSKHLKIVEWHVYPNWNVTGIALKPGVERPEAGIVRQAKRRQFPRRDRKEFDKFFKSLQAGMLRYGDETSPLRDYEFWEGVDDKPADCMVVVRILEHQPDVHSALADIKRLARRAAFFCIQPDFRGMDYWKETIGQYFMMGDVSEQGGTIGLVATAKTLIPGAKIVTAGTDEMIWDNITKSTSRHKEIVQGAPVHDRTAIIACYGPSLKKTIGELRAEQSDKADVVSVSGSHDFLLGHGIVPRFHVECDPREHKADNIKGPHPETEYLIASSCHPKMFGKIEGARVRLWHVVSGELSVRVVDQLKSKAPIIHGGGSVGLRAIKVMFHKGYRKFSIHGMDCSFSDDGEDKWAGAHAQKENQKSLTLARVRYNGRYFTTSGILLSYGTDFFDMMNRMLEVDPSLTIAMRGDGLLQARFYGPADQPIQILLNQEAA